MNRSLLCKNAPGDKIIIIAEGNRRTVMNAWCSSRVETRGSESFKDRAGKRKEKEP